LDYPPYWNYIESIGRKEHRPFKRALRKPLTRFEREFTPHLLDGETYLPVSTIMEVPGRNHSRTLKVAEGKLALEENSFFANRLIKSNATYEGGRWQHTAGPSARVTLSGLHFYTFEFDVADLGFFRTQLSWANWTCKEINCPMGRLFTACSKWIDFRGITVCWSGSKSLHIHIAFDTVPLIDQFGVPDGDPRPGLIAQWGMLEPLVLEKLDLIDSGHRPDPQLRYPEQFRRLPNGHRVIDKDNLLGIPIGTRVKQVTLWEKWMEGRTAQGATGLFHLPTSFAQPPARKAKATHRSVKGDASGQFTDDEIAYCEARLRDIYPDTGWPRLDHLVCEAGTWKASFFNSAADRNPASFMRGDYRTILFEGRDADGLKSVPLDASLDEMMRRWVMTYHAPRVEEVLLDAPSHDGNAKIERAFALATTFDDARAVLDQHLPATVLWSPKLLVHAPEGATKTTTLMRHHPRIAKHLATIDTSHSASPRRAMYAFGNYDEAQKKCEAFNAMHAGSAFVGVVLESFSHCYKEACRDLGMPPIEKQKAAQQGFRSQWAAIEKRQPEIMNWLRHRHAELWAQVGDRQLVFFTVHQVAHSWHLSTKTRMMWAPSYWAGDADERTKVCRAETRLSMVVHDEVQKSTFMEAVSDRTKTWIDGLRATQHRQWSDLSLREQEIAFRQFRKTNPFDIDYHRALTLAGLDFDPPVAVQDTGEYANQFGDRDIYFARHGRRWWMSPRKWWNDIDAQRVVFLTTEEVPTALAQKADPGIRVIRLDAECLPRHTVDVHTDRSITAANLQKLVDEWREGHGKAWFPISNKLDETGDGTNHARAKGSNEFGGCKIVQTMTFLSADEYEELQALNAYCGRDDLVLLRHIDEFNQTAGRNLGFRYQPGAEHTLLASDNLFERLIPKLGYSRYDLRRHLGSEKRRELKRRPSRADQREAKRLAQAEATATIIPPSVRGAIGVPAPATVLIGCAANGNTLRRMAA